MLPSLVPPERQNETARIIAPELEHRIIKLKNIIDDGLVDNESSNGRWVFPSVSYEGLNTL